MTEQQIIVTLATKVMGWKRYQETDFWFGDNGNLFNSSFWNPMENIADAWMIVEKFKNGDPILRAKFAVLLPVLIYEIEPKDICKAAMKVVEQGGSNSEKGLRVQNHSEHLLG
ncbi:BC1872 family protein [Brevibacillus laterosporus]|uniref:Phage ABA sandwich domain-containing protein n=1 Tax=Brevibacillus laterosporus TaxID=1465 RepID=A0AAP3DJ73_BRELA|nr:hypothetical protein [Brevibacillus laterosporus]MCR8980915.1 hypothetical protein [Brevibacillus laterosporus]MCZ0808070.1 hypothetical protein [Brevibacillus laterosporus]MCZ0826262.1 hypothetical protein [Brevibacillus laterosporus]MCZ0850145.1 hypothetical protein [Brevibacillus laterosporus]